MVKKGKVLCDSNIVINLFDRRGEQYEQALKSIASIGMDNLLIAAITEMKVIKGIRNKEHEHQGTEKIGKDQHCRLGRQHWGKNRGTPAEIPPQLGGLHILDALIAATAIEADLPLLTYNRKDFRFIKDLDLI